ncbi:MAG: hypothetical protein A2Y76_06450 [Planctomycetes bacterium RBG_13_60_9]|nr:MAG: hypothetical protein A2Y76_06450 [Planctomycetes bacterium RBG_13_60_9]
MIALLPLGATGLAQVQTFARSFEILNGDFYFGLGCRVDPSRPWDRKPLPPATGDILRVKAEFVK